MPQRRHGGRSRAVLTIDDEDLLLENTLARLYAGSRSAPVSPRTAARARSWKRPAALVGVLLVLAAFSAATNVLWAGGLGGLGDDRGEAMTTTARPLREAASSLHAAAGTTLRNAVTTVAGQTGHFAAPSAPPPTDNKCSATTDGGPCKWWSTRTPYGTEKGTTCVHSADTPVDEAKSAAAAGGPFETELECCARYCTACKGGRVELRDVVGSSTGRTTETSNATVTGDAWLPSNDAEGTCRDCTPSGLRWTAMRKHPCPCEVLSGRRILFVGDSYVRHAYVAFILWLSGDYAAGALRADHDEICEGEGQFEEKVCRGQLSRNVTVPCGVTVALKYGTWPKPDREDLSNNDYIVWGVGNHPLDGDYETKMGVNDAYVAQHLYFRRRACKDLPRAEMADKVVFLRTHVRQTGGKSEDRETLQSYHDDIPSVLLNECGITRTASVWNATEALVDLHPEDAANMTWDGAHWGSAVNAYKSYDVLNAMLEN